jgi:3-hydroxyisobutyrate dehydrogenase-like beta-hydroxyacid dehydrogenase
VSEGVSLAQAAGLEGSDLLAVLELGAISAPMFKMKGPALIKGGPFVTAFPLKHQQKDLRLALELGAAAGVPLPVAAAANAQFVRALAEGHGDEDFAAVHAASRK